MNIEYKLKIREVPHKKTVYVGSLNKSSAIIKIFSKKQDFLKEVKGVLLLISASVKTPRILFQGKQKENWIIAYEKIENAQTAFEFVNSEKNEIKKNKVIAKIILINEDMAQKNLIQKDNYLKNYLINKNGDIYVIDGEQIKKINCFNYLMKWKYLALLISKLDINQFNFVVEKFNYKNNIFFQYYYYFSKYKEIIKFKKKCLRNSTDFETYYIANKKVIKKRESYFNESILKTLDKQNIIKDGNTCTVFQYKDFVIKRYNIKSVWHFLRLQFTKSRAINSWQASNIFNLLGIATAEPVCVIQKRKAFFVTESLFVTRLINGENITEYMKNYYRENKMPSKILHKKLQVLLLQLKFHKIFHGDLKFSNLLFNKKLNELYVIDLDSVKFFRMNKLFNFYHRKDLQRLNLTLNKQWRFES